VGVDPVIVELAEVKLYIPVGLVKSILPDIVVVGEVIVNDPAPLLVRVLCFAMSKILPPAVRSKDELLL